MSDQIRKDLLEAFAELCEKYPHWRFAQTLCNVALWAKAPGPEQIWDLEDQDLLDAIRKHLARDTGESAATEQTATTSSQ